MGSEWIDLVYEEGLLNWGFTRAARLVGYEFDHYVLTNRVVSGFAAAVWKPFGFDTWSGPISWVGTGGLHFPYGQNVYGP